MLTIRKKYRINSTRLKNVDYSDEGDYHITICTHNKTNFFGRIENGEMILSEIGKIAEDLLKEIPIHTKSAKLGEYIIMPNHIHGIISISYSKQSENSSTGGALPLLNDKDNFALLPRKSISTIIGSYKSALTKKINLLYPEKKFKWQERFFDHIIRDIIDYKRIEEYIRDNPKNYYTKNNNKNRRDNVPSQQINKMSNVPSQQINKMSNAPSQQSNLHNKPEI